MILKNLLVDIDYKIIKGHLNNDINGLCYDSRKAKTNYIFFAIKGFNVDGHKFIKKAIELGANTIVLEELNEDYIFDGTIIQVDDTKKAMSKIAINYYNKPISKFNLYGITGTNGKTTTSYLIKSILENTGDKVGLIGTIGNIIDGKFKKSTHTTPESIDLQNIFNDMNKSNIDSCIMEVSSHSLALDRVYGNTFDTSIFTNLSKEHMDFHKDLDDYFDAKSKLFDMSKNCVINIDDHYGKKLYDKLIKDKNKKILSYSINTKADIYATNIINDIDGASFLLNTDEGSINIKLHAPGIFNVYNALGACGACLLNNISLTSMKEGFENINGVRGRFEVFKPKNNKFSVIIDYAHTPDGYENIFKTVDEFAKGKKTVIFGCGGDRDATKRPIMGDLASNYNDLVILTTDNPRTEDPNKIILDIKKGIKKDNSIFIEDRKEAIEYAIKNAVENEVILVIGKGHESYQLINNKVIEFNENEIIKNALNM